MNKRFPSLKNESRWHDLFNHASGCSVYRVLMTSSMTISSARARMLFILPTHTKGCSAFRRSVTPSRSFICFVSSSIMASVLSFASARCLWRVPFRISLSCRPGCTSSKYVLPDGPMIVIIIHQVRIVHPFFAQGVCAAKFCKQRFHCISLHHSILNHKGYYILQ